MCADEMTDDEKRRDQLTSAPKSGPEDAAPRIEVTKNGGATRIDIRDDADVRPGLGQTGPSSTGG